jgi:hypothetical protein
MIQALGAVAYRFFDQQQKLQRKVKKMGEKSLPHFWNLDERPSNYRSHPAGFNGKKIQVSASSQPSESELRDLIENRGVDIVVDLREEPHGFASLLLKKEDLPSWESTRQPLDFSDSNPHFRSLAISYTNFGNLPNPAISMESLLKKEKKIFQEVRRQSALDLSLLSWSQLSQMTNPPQKPLLWHYPMAKALSERELVQNINQQREKKGLSPVEYYRVPITDELAPEPRDVDDLVKIYKYAVLSGKNIHFHCVGGYGRTTTALVITQIIDGKRFEEALDYESEKNPLIGKSAHDLRKIRKNFYSDPLKLEKVAVRIGMLYRFYEYWNSTAKEKESFERFMKKHPLTKKDVANMKNYIVFV